MRILDDLKSGYKNGSSMIKLLYVNVAVFLLVNLLGLFLGGTDPIVQWLAVPAAPGNLLMRFWTPFTYMFLHTGLWHAAFNMLWLYWFGQVFLVFMTQRQFWGVYALGGFSGALLYILVYNLVPSLNAENSRALGASAAVLAIVVAAATYRPDFRLHLMFFGQVKIKYIGMVIVGLDVFSILGNSSNLGGHLAHLGGAIFGFFYARQLNSGKDIAKGFLRGWDRLVEMVTPNRDAPLRVTHRAAKPSTPPGTPPPTRDMDYNARKKSEQERMDQILDKISRSGYDSLTKEEKDLLFRMSKND